VCVEKRGCGGVQKTVQESSRSGVSEFTMQLTAQLAITEVLLFDSFVVVVVIVFICYCFCVGWGFSYGWEGFSNKTLNLSDLLSFVHLILL